MRSKTSLDLVSLLANGFFILLPRAYPFEASSCSSFSSGMPLIYDSKMEKSYNEYDQTFYDKAHKDLSLNALELNEDE